MNGVIDNLLSCADRAVCIAKLRRARIRRLKVVYLRWNAKQLEDTLKLCIQGSAEIRHIEVNCVRWDAETYVKVTSSWMGCTCYLVVNNNGELQCMVYTDKPRMGILSKTIRSGVNVIPLSGVLDEFLKHEQKVLQAFEDHKNRKESAYLLHLLTCTSSSVFAKDLARRLK